MQLVIVQLWCVFAGVHTVSDCIFLMLITIPSYGVQILALALTVSYRNVVIQVMHNVICVSAKPCTEEPIVVLRRRPASNMY